MSPDFIATTETGSIYRRMDGHLLVKGVYWHNAVMRVVPTEVRDSWAGRQPDWEYLSTLPIADLPVEGECLYVQTLKEWRISTPIATLELP
jgi:hypothetical protein